LILFANRFSFGASLEMAPRRQPPRERAAPEGFIRAEDVQRLVQEALAAERAQPAAPQEPAQISELAPVVEQQQDAAQDLEYERYSRCLARFQKARPPPFGGEPDPEHTDAWIVEIEKIFKSLRCPREYWVELAAYT
jgi:hypothetical protein